MKSTRVLPLVGSFLFLFCPAIASARIKLVTLPVRQRVEVQLDNPNATLVEEERIVPLVKGVNQVDFSWANTQIDPDTIVFRVIEPMAGGPRIAGKPITVNVLSVSYPPNENALVWQVAASDSTSARVRISYVLGGLTKSFNYRAVASHDEKTLTLWQYIRLENFANEEFFSADAPTEGAQLWAGFGKGFVKPIGLNETKQILAVKYDQVPVRKTYTCNPAEFGYTDEAQNKLRVPMHYVLTNDKKHNLGGSSLPYGKVRIFQDDGKGGGPGGSTAFIGEDWGKFTPLDDEMTLYLGVAQDIVVKRTIDHSEHTRVAGNLFNQDVVVKYEIENFKNSPVTLDVVESPRFVRSQVLGNADRDIQWELGKQTDFDGGPDGDKTTYEKVVFHVDLPARAADGKAEKIVKRMEMVFKNEW